MVARPYARPRGNRYVARDVWNVVKYVLAAALVLSACGSHAAAPGADASPTAPRTVMVTTAADKTTVTVHAGDLVQIALGEQFTWQVDPPDGVVLVQPIQNYMLVRGTQAIWLAKSPGRAQIKATGGAVCGAGTPCPLFAVLFSATVEVQP